MATLIHRARQRLYRNQLMAQGAHASSAALMALILLLLLGTQILDWRWIVLVAGLAGGAGLYRARKLVPSSYAVAQMVDHRAGLADSLSTALYFSQDPPPAHSSPAMRQVQSQQANRMSETVDVRKATPYTMPRTVYLLGALLVVAGSLFALRYGLSRRLDLRPTLASMLPFQLGWHERTALAENTRRQAPHGLDPQDDDGATLADPDRQPAGDPDSAANDMSEGSGDPSTEKSSGSKGQAKPGEKGDKAGDQEAQAEQGSDSSNADQSSQRGNNKQDAKQASAGKQDSGNTGENSSLMSKVKDLFQNLLSSVKPPQNSPSSQQQNSDQNNQQGKGQQNGGKQQQGNKNGQQQSNGNPGDSQDGQQGEQAQSPQDPQGKGNGKSDSQQASKMPGSGIGNQDGDKSIKQAEDLAAMGKITELFGKRSATITGEATVEVQSTSQQLHTPYAQRPVEHGQSGAEINRDEIPVAVQPYVQQYFEQVRRQAAPAVVKKK